MIRYDSKDDPSGYTRLFLGTHLHASGCSNISMRDVRTIDTYCEFSLRVKCYNIPLWHRVDFVRLLILQHAVYKSLSPTNHIADMDVDDIMGKNGDYEDKIKKNISDKGFCLGSVASRMIDDKTIENGFLILSNNGKGKEYIDYLINYIKENYSIDHALYNRDAIYNLFYDATFDFAKRKLSISVMELGSQSIPALNQCFFSPPQNDSYCGISTIGPK